MEFLTYDEAAHTWSGNGYYPGSSKCGQVNGVDFYGPYQAPTGGWFVRIGGEHICCNQTSATGEPIDAPIEGIQLVEFLQSHAANA